MRDSNYDTGNNGAATTDADKMVYEGEFGAMLALLRNAAGLGQQQLADAVNVDVAVIGDLERGARITKHLNIIACLAAALNVPVTHFLVSEDGPGKHIRMARAQRGISQRQLAKQIGMSQSMLSRIEANNRSLNSLRLIKKLAEAFTVTPMVVVAWLTGATDDPYCPTCGRGES